MPHIEVTKPTITMLRIHSHSGNLVGGNVQNMNGLHRIWLDQDVHDRLQEVGADMDDPTSIEQTILKIVKELEK